MCSSRGRDRTYDFLINSQALLPTELPWNGAPGWVLTSVSHSKAWVFSLKLLEHGRWDVHETPTSRQGRVLSVLSYQRIRTRIVNELGSFAAFVGGAPENRTQLVIKTRCLQHRPDPYGSNTPEL